MTETLVTTVFPEDNQKHAFLYEDSTIHTINQGMRILHRISNPVLRFRQVLSLKNLTLDRSYEGLLRYQEEQGILYVTFPSECGAVGGFRSNRPCKMVTYYQDPRNEYIKEIELTPRSTLALLHTRPTTMIVYTRLQCDLQISFDVYLIKPHTFPPSKL